MKKLFSTKMTNVGGRSGEVSSPDKSLSLKMAPHGTDPKATDPEQLFAAGYSSCFNSALEMVLLQDKIKAPSTVSVTVSLYEQGPEDYVIGVEIEGSAEGVSKEKMQEYLEKAHVVCPYSKATRGNVDVKLQAV